MASRQGRVLLNSALESTGAARPAAQEIARYASHGSERNRSGVLAKGIGGPNVDLGNHAIDNLARNLDWLDTRRPDPVALGRRDFYLLVGFAQWCGRFRGAVGGIQNLRLKANYASLCSPSPKISEGFARNFARGRSIDLTIAIDQARTRCAEGRALARVSANRGRALAQWPDYRGD
jgi:hypothetical protein